MRKSDILSQLRIFKSRRFLWHTKRVNAKCITLTERFDGIEVELNSHRFPLSYCRDDKLL